MSILIKPRLVFPSLQTWIVRTSDYHYLYIGEIDILTYPRIGVEGMSRKHRACQVGFWPDADLSSSETIEDVNSGG